MCTQILAAMYSPGGCSCGWGQASVMLTRSLVSVDKINKPFYPPGCCHFSLRQETISTQYLHNIYTITNYLHNIYKSIYTLSTLHFASKYPYLFFFTCNCTLPWFATICNINMLCLCMQILKVPDS